MTDLEAERAAWEGRTADRRLTHNARTVLRSAGWDATRKQLEEAAAERWPEQAAAIAGRALKVRREEKTQVRHLDPATTPVQRPQLELADIEKRARRGKPAAQPTKAKETGVARGGRGLSKATNDALLDAIRFILKDNPGATQVELTRRLPSELRFAGETVRRRVMIVRAEMGISVPRHGGNRKGRPKRENLTGGTHSKPATPPVKKAKPKRASTAPTPVTAPPPDSHGTSAGPLEPVPHLVMPDGSPGVGTVIKIDGQDLHVELTRVGEHVAVTLNAKLREHEAMELVRICAREGLREAGQ